MESIANTVTEGREVRTFAHILLFRCPQCRGPLTDACPSENLDREHVATRAFKLNKLANVVGQESWMA
jgi:hypothetical protein